MPVFINRGCGDLELVSGISQCFCATLKESLVSQSSSVLQKYT